MLKPRQPKMTADNPKVSEAIERTTQTIQARKYQSGITSLKQLLDTPELKGLMQEMLRLSNLTEPQKKYLGALFFEKKSSRRAIQDALGRDVGYAVEPIRNAWNNLPEIKEFIGIIRNIYLKFTPVASMKEFQMIFDPLVDPKVKLEAIKDIKSTAGIGEEQSKSTELPVHINLNFNKVEAPVIEGKEVKDVGNG